MNSICRTVLRYCAFFVEPARYKHRHLKFAHAPTVSSLAAINQDESDPVQGLRHAMVSDLCQLLIATRPTATRAG